MERNIYSQITEEATISRRQALLLTGVAGLMLAGCSPDHSTVTPSTSPTVESATPETSASPEISRPLYGPDTSRADTPVYPGIYGAPRPQGLLDAVKMREAGVAYHIAKASRGHLDTDNFPWREPNFKESRLRADDAGLLFGAYHFLNAGYPAEQAEAFVRRMVETGGIKGAMHFVDFEQYSGNGNKGNTKKYNPSHDDLLEFVEMHQLLTDGHPLGVYSANWYWGGAERTPLTDITQDAGAKHSILKNPDAPEGTYLWWCRPVRPFPPMRQFSEYNGLLSAPDSNDDPWKNEQLGTYPEFIFRQFVLNDKRANSGALLQQFDGSTAKTGHLMSLDFNVSFKPHSYLLSLAGLEADALPQPTSLSA